MIFAIDFDGTLTDIKFQLKVKKLLNEKNDIWVITKRKKSDKNEELLMVLNKINLPIFKVIFTERKPKYEFLKAINADFFIDNNDEEFAEINNFTNIVSLKF